MLLGERRLMQKVNRRSPHISWDVLQAEVCDEIVHRRIRVILGDAAKARRQFVLHAKTGKSRQDSFPVVVAQLVVTESAVVTSDADLTAGYVGALMLRD